MATTIPILTIAVAVSMLALPSAALHCNGDITKSGLGPKTLRIDDRSTAPVPINHWFYPESNHLEMLQSGGEGPICPGDPCTHRDHDTFIF